MNQSRNERNQNELNKLLTLPNKVFSFGLISLAHNSFIGIEKSTMKGASLMIHLSYSPLRMLSETLFSRSANLQIERFHSLQEKQQ